MLDLPSLTTDWLYNGEKLRKLKIQVLSSIFFLYVSSYSIHMKKNKFLFELYCNKDYNLTKFKFPHSDEGEGAFHRFWKKIIQAL